MADAELSDLALAALTFAAGDDEVQLLQNAAGSWAAIGAGLLVPIPEEDAQQLVDRGLIVGLGLGGNRWMWIAHDDGHRALAAAVADGWRMPL